MVTITESNEPVYVLNWACGETEVFRNKYRALYKLLNGYFTDTLRDELNDITGSLASDISKNSDIISRINAIELDLQNFFNHDDIPDVGSIISANIIN